MGSLIEKLAIEVCIQAHSWAEGARHKWTGLQGPLLTQKMRGQELPR